MTPRLFCFGYSYCARHLAMRLRPQGFDIAGTSREPSGGASEVERFAFDGRAPLAPAALGGTTHLLISIPPGPAGDPVLATHRDMLARLPGLGWIGYLSTTGVYGDRQGEWVDEEADLRPVSPRSRRRVDAEAAWLAFGAETGVPTHVFRLAGIYGPGRSTLEQVRSGQAQRIDRPGQVFSRIHVEDIAAVLEASIRRPAAGRIYNVCDDEPAAPADVVSEACRLLGVPPPPLIPYEEAALSEMGRSFWADNRRVRNERIKSELGVALRYPSYREGLAALAVKEF